MIKIHVEAIIPWDFQCALTFTDFFSEKKLIFISVAAEFIYICKTDE